MSKIPITTLELPAAGRHLRRGPLGAQLGPGRTLLAFLRHLG